MNDFIFKYRCRRCLVTYDGGECGKKNAVSFMAMIVSGQTTPGIPLKINDFHICFDNHLGIADLIGGEYVNEGRI